MAWLVPLVGCADPSPPGLPDAGPAGPFHRTPDLSRMVEIPPSIFRMGHPEERPGDYGQVWKENELPAHEVTLGAFRIDRDEVTVADYAEFLTDAGGEVHRHPLQPFVVTSDGYAALETTASRPIAMVSWYDAVTYCAWAGKRLPTEAQWERAARGPSGRTWPWGDEGPSCDRAIFFTGTTPCARGAQPVGGRPAGDSEEGLHDMAGNVAEWVADVYDRYPADAQLDPIGPGSGRYRVVRGGSFLEAGSSLRATARWAAEPADRSTALGFRCAL